MARKIEIDLSGKLGHSALQLGSSLGGAFTNRVACNVLAYDKPIAKGIISGGLSLGLFAVSFLEMNPFLADIVKGFAYGSILETANRYIVKRIEKTTWGGKYFNGDDTTEQKAPPKNEREIRVTEEQLKQLTANGYSETLPENTPNGEQEEYPNGEQEEYQNGYDEEYSNGIAETTIRPIIM